MFRFRRLRTLEKFTAILASVFRIPEVLDFR